MTLSIPSFPRKIALLGSTGSIGRQTLDVVRAYPEAFEIVALAARNNIDLLIEQIREFRPKLVACDTDDPAIRMKVSKLLPGAILGLDGLIAAATHPDVDILVVATSGLIGLRPTLAAIEEGKTIAIANKETLVMAGHLVTAAAQRKGIELRPVDSEHCALWQCLRGEEQDSVDQLIITASGGPFRRVSREEMASVTVAQALAHPTWKMGPKITIDSATLMNKGLEVIEAHWLFGIPYSRIQIVVHPQSIIHSMVRFIDGSVKMQASLPTMHLPIQEALSHPVRLDRADTNLLPDLDLAAIGHLDFEEVDIDRFPCLRIALEAGARGGTYPAVLVGADEAAVARFLRGDIKLMEIAAVIEQVLADHVADAVSDPDLETVLAACEWARTRCEQIMHV
jgi:1-deoxy-D-xylulose-5-phosphate reductoisomerase